MIQILVALVFLGVPALAASIGYVQGVEGAKNLYLFWVWGQLAASMIVCGMFVAVGNKLSNPSDVSKEKGFLEQQMMVAIFAPLLASSMLLPAWYGSWVLALVYGSGLLLIGYGGKQLNTSKQIQFPQGVFVVVATAIVWIGIVWSGCVLDVDGARNIVLWGISLGFTRAAFELVFKVLKLKSENQSAAAIPKLILVGRECIALSIFVWQGYWVLVAALIAKFLLQYLSVVLTRASQAKDAEVSQAMDKLAEMRAVSDAWRR